MNRRQIIRIISLLLLVMFLVKIPVNANAVTQEEIDELRAIRDEVAAQREAAQAVVDGLEQQQAGVVELKTAMDERNSYTLQQMQLNSEEIALFDELIADKAQEVEAAKTLEEEQLNRYRARVRAMEENGSYNYLAMILRTSSLGELLTVIDDVGEIMQSDRDLENAYIAARENTQQVQTEFEAYKLELETKQETLRTEQTALQQDIDEATALIQQLQLDIDTHQDEVDEILQAEREADEALAAKVAEMEAERQAELERLRQEEAERLQSVSNAYSTGSFTWPVPSCSYVTSRFGLRIHPISGEEKSHNGIDVGAAYGAAVIAADGGVVTLADVYGGYGNCVMIDHGNGYVTLYGHLSSISVSEGQGVSSGSTIGYVGSSGIATGPHLHFEVFSGGSRIDPEQFFSGLTFAPDAGQ